MSIIRYQFPELKPWSAFDRFSSLRNILDSTFQLANGASTSQSWVPALEVFENEESVIVRLEAAGLKKEDFDISLHEDVLTIAGQREKPAEGDKVRSERVYGTFSRSLTLAKPVRNDAVTADYQDGVLTITLPKAEEAKPKKIQVNLN